VELQSFEGFLRNVWRNQLSVNQRVSSFLTFLTNPSKLRIYRCKLLWSQKLWSKCKPGLTHSYCMLPKRSGRQMDHWSLYQANMSTQEWDWRELCLLSKIKDRIMTRIFLFQYLTLLER
jgi:hypothetical protein